VYVDVNSVPEMTLRVFDESSQVLTVGAAVSLDDLIESLRYYSKDISAFASASATAFSTVSIPINNTANNACCSSPSAPVRNRGQEGKVDGTARRSTAAEVDYRNVFSVTAHHLSLIANSQVQFYYTIQDSIYTEACYS